MSSNDVKDKFAPVIQHFEEIVANSRRLGKTWTPSS